MKDVRIIVSAAGLSTVHYDADELVLGRARLRLLLSTFVLVRYHLTWCITATPISVAASHIELVRFLLPNAVR